MLPYDQRAAIWEWCREYIDRECIYRVDDEHPPIPGKAAGSSYVWQVYSRRGSLHPLFARYLGLLFWDHFLTCFVRQPFQVCACAPSGIALGMAIAGVGRTLGVGVNVFIARREPKSYGVGNWFDGRALALPVLLLDDAAASAPYLKLASVRIQQKLGLPLHRNYFTLINKVGRNFSARAQHTENYLDNELIAFFTMNNFCVTAGAFKDRYGTAPKWTGVVR